MNIPPVETHLTRIENRQRRLRILPRKVKELVALVLDGEGIPAGEVSLLLVNNTAIRRFNRELLGRTGATDVISIPQGPGFPGGVPIPVLGDVIISTEQVIEQAPRFGQTPEEELQLCLIHGVLHLLGYEDAPAERRARMARRERYHLARARRLGIGCCER